MSFECSPIVRAFARGERKQALRKQKETPQERLKREQYRKKCEQKVGKWNELSRQKALKDKEKFARRLARKRKQDSNQETQSWEEIEWPEYQGNHTPQQQGELRGNATGQLGVSTPLQSNSAIPAEAKRSINRKKKHKKIDPETIRKLLTHYCYLRRRGCKKNPLKSTVLYGEQQRPPVYISDSTLHSWINNPKHGVNKDTWTIGDKPADCSAKGRPSILDSATLQYLQDAITAVRHEIGARLSITMVQNIFKRLLVDQGKGHLVGDGPGQLKISRTWTRDFMTRRMKWRYKAVTSCTKYLPKDWVEKQRNFVLQVAHLVGHYHLTEDDVYNIDETNMLYNPAGKSKTWNRSGKIPGTDEYHPCEAYDHDSKQMITIVCGITASGKRLPLQYIFEGKQYKEKKDKMTGKMVRRRDDSGNQIPQFGSCPMHCKPQDANFVQTPNHWANADTTLTFFDEVVMRHADTRPDPSKPILVIWVNAKFHCTQEFRKRLSDKYGDKIILCYLPTNTTSKLQPLDVSVNGAFKQAAKKRFSEVAAEKCISQLKGNSTAYHDLHRNVSKVSSVKLVDITQTAWDRLSTEVVMSGWRKSGIIDIFDTDVQKEAFELSLMSKLPMTCLNTRTGKVDQLESELRFTLDVLGEEEDASEAWDETLCDDEDIMVDNEVTEEEIVAILARMRTTKRTQAVGGA